MAQDSFENNLYFVEPSEMYTTRYSISIYCPRIYQAFIRNVVYLTITITTDL